MIYRGKQRRFFRQRFVQGLILYALDGHDWLSVHELADRMTMFNDGVRIPPHVRDAAATQLYRRAFLEMRLCDRSLSSIVEIRIRNDAHRQWRCGARHWVAPPITTGSHIE